MVHNVILALAAVGVVGQILIGLTLLLALVAGVGVRRPLRSVRRAVWGYELWLAFLVALVATAGSLFFSEVAHFIPCELCWFQRICMYPLTVLLGGMTVANDHRAVRYILPLPVAGASVATYHILVERGVVAQAHSCLMSAPGGCATRWIDQWGWITIPTLALTAFLLITLLAVAALTGEDPNSDTDPGRTVASDG